MNFLQRCGAFVLSIYLLLGLLLFVFQRQFIYFPTPAIEHSFSREQFINAGERLEVLSLNTGRKKALLYFGGNAESVLVSAPELATVLADYSIYAVNYRGYGNSSGSPSETALYSDAQFIFDRLAVRHSRVTVMGRSLGSGVASFLAAHRKIDRLVLVTPFDSIRHLAQDRFPLYPMSLLLRDDYDSVGRAGSITAPTLVVLAKNDRVIPLRYSTLLIEALPPEQLQVKTLAGVGHNDLSVIDDYYRHLREFLR